MKTFTGAAKIYGMTLTKDTEISDVCRHLEDCHKQYEVGAGGIVLTRHANGYPAMCLHKVNGIWCFILE